MPRYIARIRLEYDAIDEADALAIAQSFATEGHSSLVYEAIVPPASMTASAKVLGPRKGRQTKCGNCAGSGKVKGHAAYPGTLAYRPTVDCPTCKGSGTVTVYR